MTTDCEIRADILERALTVALKHASTDETHPHLAAVKFERFAAGVRVVATDGHRLSIHDFPCTGVALGGLIPREQCKALLSAVKVYRKGLSKQERDIATVKVMGLTVTLGATSMQLVPSSEQFPSYGQVIPEYDAERESETVGISASYLGDAAEACGLVAPAKSGAMTVTLGEPLQPATFHASSPEGESLTVIVMPMRI